MTAALAVIAQRRLCERRKKLSTELLRHGHLITEDVVIVGMSVKKELQPCSSARFDESPEYATDHIGAIIFFRISWPK